MRRGITIAGNIMVDAIKYVEGYPRQGMLASILGLDRSVGGVLGNTLVDLAKLDPTLRLKAMGRIGQDEAGAYARAHLEACGVDVSGLEVVPGESTSFTDVIQDRCTGQRTFFTFGGANDGLSYDTLDFDAIDTDIFHLGYALLLRGMDAPDAEYGTVMAKTLDRVQRMGIKTSMDVVSEDSPRAAGIVRSSLPYCDYFIANEEEAGTAAGIPARDADGRLRTERMRPILEKLFALGVGEIAMIHCPEGGFAMTAAGEYFETPSLRLPEGFIVSSVGAGDAFCAGALYGIYQGWDMPRCMELGNGAAAACLSGHGGTTNMRTVEGVCALMRELGG